MRWTNWGTIDANLSLAKKAKSIGISILGKLHRYRLSETPILLFATRRGGSTLLMRMLASQPNTDFCGEPLNFWRFNPHYGRLPHPPRSRFITLDSADDERFLQAYFADLLSGRIKAFNHWRFWEPDFSWTVHRLAVKVLGANNLIDWFNRHFGAHLLYLVRHPIPVAQSAIKRNWGNDAVAYLANDDYWKRLGDEETRKFARETLDHGSDLERFVLEWCLENAVPLRLSADHHWLTLTYEETVARPDAVSKLLGERFDLPDAETMSEIIKAPSRTTLTGSRQVIQSEGPSALITRWRREIDERDVEAAQRILDAFGVTAYRASDPYPSSELCHFGAWSSAE